MKNLEENLDCPQVSNELVEYLQYIYFENLSLNKETTYDEFKINCGIAEVINLLKIANYKQKNGGL